LSAAAAGNARYFLGKKYFKNYISQKSMERYFLGLIARTRFWTFLKMSKNQKPAQTLAKTLEKGTM
jgi:hypothetical protein